LCTSLADGAPCGPVRETANPRYGPIFSSCCRYSEEGCMKPSIRNQAKGKFHEVKGQLKEKAGKLGKDRELEAKGKIETAAGKVQQKLGQVEKLVGR